MDLINKTRGQILSRKLSTTARNMHPRRFLEFNDLRNIKGAANLGSFCFGTAQSLGVDDLVRRINKISIEPDAHRIN